MLHMSGLLRQVTLLLSGNIQANKMGVSFMNKSNLKAILTSIRDMIMRSRPAYKDYLGEETVTETKELLTASGSLSGITITPAADFTGFVEGEVYNVTINGETQQMAAADITYAMNFLGGS